MPDFNESCLNHWNQTFLGIENIPSMNFFQVGGPSPSMYTKWITELNAFYTWAPADNIKRMFNMFYGGPALVRKHVN